MTAAQDLVAERRAQRIGESLLQPLVPLPVHLSYRARAIRVAEVYAFRITRRRHGQWRGQPS